MNATLRSRVRSFGAFPLALLFTLPSCITSGVWRDDRTHATRTLAAIEPDEADDVPALQAIRLPNAAGALVLDLPPTAAERLHALLPHIPATTRFLAVRPTAYTESIQLLTALAMTTSTPRLSVEVVDDPDDQPPHVAIVCSVWSLMDNRLIAELPGFHRTADLWWTATLDVRCDTEPLPALPANATERLRRLPLREVHVQDDGTPLLAKIAWTPLTVLGDLVLSPFELVWWFSN